MEKILKLIILFFLIQPLKAVNYNIIPAPVSVEYHKGVFNLEKEFIINCHSELLNESKLLMSYLSEQLIHTSIDKDKNENIFLTLDHNLCSNVSGSYKLTIDKSKITIVGSDNSGVFYGIQSLMQIIRNHYSKGFIPCGEIYDYPAFKWRAFMLDEARYFKGKQVVKDLLDRMAELKMNVFHWHLTDHQGWRIEIKKYPKLTSIGAFRDSSSIGTWKSNIYDGKPHGGFYTQDDIRDIISYANERHIMIVPEIDMPGHSSAAIAAYPELGSIDERISVPCKFGPQYNVFDVTRPEVINILKDILKEIISLFPSKIIHIGGDEVRFNQWNESESIQSYMKKNNISSPIDLQLRFSNEMSNWINSQGCRMMGWNDITGDILHEYHNDEIKTSKISLSQNTLVHFWKGNPSLITKVIKNGYEIVNSYHVYTYLDYSYKKISLQKAYNYNPIPDGLTEDERKKVLGIGCQMWGEWIPKVEDMNRQVFPRIAAIAEVGWTKYSNKDYNRFVKSLDFLDRYWKTKGVLSGMYK